MAALTASRNTPQWAGTQSYHYALVPVEASTSIYVGGMVALDASGNAVPAQVLSGTGNLRRLQIIGICEYVYAGGIVPPGLNALNQTGNGSLFPGATGTLGAAGAISVGVSRGIYGMDVDSTVTAANLGELLFAVDDHTVSLGTLTANTTSVTLPSSAASVAPVAVILKPHIVPGTFDAYSATGGGGTHYKEGTDFTVDYATGLFISYTIAASATVYTTYYSSATGVVAGELIAIDSGLAYISMLGRYAGFGF